MDIEKIVQILNSLKTDKIFKDETKFYELVNSIIDLTNISIDFEISDDSDYKMELLQTITRKVSINLETKNKELFYSLIDSDLLRYCGDERLKLEQIKTRKLEKKINKISKWIYDDKIKEEILGNGEFAGEQLDTNDIFKLVKSLNTLEKKLKYLNLYKNEFFEEHPKYVIEIIKSIDSVEARVDFYKSLSKEEFDILEALDVNSDEFILASLYRTDLDIEKKMDKIASLKSEENQMLGIDIIVASNKNELIYAKHRLIELAKRMQIDDNKERILSLAQYFRSEEGSEPEERSILSYKTGIIVSFNSDEKKLEHIDEMNYEEYIYNIILSFNDGKKMIKELINRNYFERFIKNGIDRKKFHFVIKENINQVLKYYGFEDKLYEKQKLLSRMEKDNAGIYSSIQFELLEDRYVQTFSKTQLNILASLRDEQTALFKLDDNQLKLCSILLQNQKEDDFREFFSNIVRNIKSYRKLSSNIEFSQLTKENIDLLCIIMQYNNDFDIETLDDLNNFEQIKSKKLNALAKTSDPKQIISAIIWKQYGIDYDTAERLSIEFSNEENDEQIKELKALINYAKRFETESQLLQNIYNSVTQEANICDKISLRKKYKNIYEKELNSSLLKIDDLPQMELEDGTIVYDAGTDFSMLITAVSPYIKNEDSENSKENWNRKDLGSEHFCASYIRNDMLGVCNSQLGIYYGFYGIPNESLLYMDFEDTQSSTGSALHSSINGIRIFRNTVDLINKTGNGFRQDYYNELDIKRRVNGNRIQPDYLVVFKNGEKYENLTQSIKASKEWGGLPIVVIDIDKCLEKQLEELNQISEIYTMNPDNELLENIWIKFHNMSNTILRWKTREFEKILEHAKIPNILKENIILANDFNINCSLKNRMFKKTTTKSNQEIIDDLKKAYQIDEKKKDEDEMEIKPNNIENEQLPDNSEIENNDKKNRNGGRKKIRKNT